MFKRSFALAAAIAMSSMCAVSAFAADLPVKASAFVPVPVTCTPGNCSGLFGGFGFAGNGTNTDIIGGGINGSVFSAGGALKVDGGYQFWSGSWFAALDLAVGYQFTTTTSAGIPSTNANGSRVLGEELIKLGYNFFPSTASATTAPSQSPVPLITPANLLAASTPYVVGGGCQTKGRNTWCNGVGVEMVIASGWSASADYLYAPAQAGADAVSIVQLSLHKHFNVKGF